MSDLKFMPMYWADFMADTRHLHGYAAGAYSLLLGNMWMQGGWVPDDDEQLARMCGLDLQQWLAVRPLIRPFLIRRHRRLSQKRLLSVHKSALETHQKNAVKTAKMRQGKREKKQDVAATKESNARARPDIGTTDTNVSVELQNGASRRSAHARENKSRKKDPMIEEIDRRRAALRQQMEDTDDGYLILPPESHH